MTNESNKEVKMTDNAEDGNRLQTIQRTRGSRFPVYDKRGFRYFTKTVLQHKILIAFYRVYKGFETTFPVVF